MKIDLCMIEAIEFVETYIEKTTGTRPTQRELAEALTKFFVLKEIREFIEMSRADPDL